MPFPRGDVGEKYRESDAFCSDVGENSRESAFQRVLLPFRDGDADSQRVGVAFPRLGAESPDFDPTFPTRDSEVPMNDLSAHEENLRIALRELVEAAYASGSVISVLQAPIKFCVDRGELSPVHFDLPDELPETEAAHLAHLEKTWAWIETHGNDHSFEPDSPLGLAVRSLKFAPIEIEQVINSLNLKGVFAEFVSLQQKVLQAREAMYLAAAEVFQIPTEFAQLNSPLASRAMALKEASNEYDPFASFDFLIYGRAVLKRDFGD